jgi:tetratricopeptide (TPR) repeat protein
MMKRAFLTALVCLGLCMPLTGRTSTPADNWFEIKSGNFTVWANANDGNTRTVVWQLEQMRHVAKQLWPWMKVDLPKPLIILAAKDEQTLKTLAPTYWEVKGGVRPGSVWVTAPDQNYIAIRTDMRSRDDVMVNPHTSVYFSYANLVLGSSFERPLPPWISRGLSGVLSNTLVRQNDVIVGAAIPWHLEALRRRRMPLTEMLAMNRTSPALRKDAELGQFDAQSWAFVHYLMFSDGGVHAPKLNAFVAAVAGGQPVDRAFAASIGNVDEYEHAFSNYVNRNLYSAARIKVDMGVDKERFPARPMTPAESALARASFHVAMRQTAEARALIDEALKLDPQAANAFAVEALMLDQGGNADGARAAYARAVELGTTNPYALYRSAMIEWRNAGPSTMEKVEQALARAVELNPLYASAHAALAEARAVLKRSSAVIVPHMHKAVALEPSSPWHRLAGARVLIRLNTLDEARKAAESAIQLAADDPQVRAEAERILAFLDGK